jgi:energy-coupling factor transporter ATP-binding protein EcfA2
MESYTTSPRFYHTVEVGDFPIGNYMLEKYGFHHRFRLSGTSLLKKNFYQWMLDNLSPSLLFLDSLSLKKNGIDIHEVFYELPQHKAIIKLVQNDREKKLGESHFVPVLYYSDPDLVKDLIHEMITTFYVKRTYQPESSNICLIIQNGPSLDTVEYGVKIKDVDVELNYGKKFIPTFNNIIKRLNTKSDKGIILLHGEPGTGKTSLIKYIAKKVKKQILFVPPSMAESITSPSFIPFLMEHSDSILIIEDAERILTSREQQGSNLGVTNILNLSDGILGDCLNIQVVATFNTNLKNIDTALLRKGRLIAEYEFGKLNIEESNKLLNHLGKDNVTDKPMTLTEIYNVDKEEFRSTQSRQAVGFNTH